MITPDFSGTTENKSAQAEAPEARVWRALSPALWFVAVLLLGSSGACLADSISAGSTSETYSPGTPLNALELAALGIDGNLFLFTGNTAYNYNGTYLLNLIGAPIDPSTVGSLSGVPTTNVIVDLSGSQGNAPSSGLGNDSTGGMPEPATATLLGIGVLVLAVSGATVHAHRAGRSLAWSSTNSDTDNASARRPRSGIPASTSRE